MEVSKDNINYSSICRINCSYSTFPLTNVSDPFREVFESARANYLALTLPKCTEKLNPILFEENKSKISNELIDYTYFLRD